MVHLSIQSSRRLDIEKSVPPTLVTPFPDVREDRNSLPMSTIASIESRNSCFGCQFE
jgi:hypothetical protein